VTDDDLDLDTAFERFRTAFDALPEDRKAAVAQAMLDEMIEVKQA
jgi:hypothetical protein